MPKRKHNSHDSESPSPRTKPRKPEKERDLSLYDSTSSEDEEMKRTSPQVHVRRRSSGKRHRHSNNSSRDGSQEHSREHSRERSVSKDRSYYDKLLNQEDFNDFPGAGCVKLHFTQLGKLSITGEDLELLALFTKSASHRLKYAGSSSRIEVDIERVTSLAVRGRELSVAYTPLAQSLMDMDLTVPPMPRGRPPFGNGGRPNFIEGGRPHFGEERSRSHHNEGSRAHYGEQKSRPHYDSGRYDESHGRPHYGEEEGERRSRHRDRYGSAERYERRSPYAERRSPYSDRKRK